MGQARQFRHGRGEVERLRRNGGGEEGEVEEEKRRWRRGNFWKYVMRGGGYRNI